MRRISTILAIILIAAISCQKESDSNSALSQPAEIEFSIDIPGTKTPQTKAIVESGMIDDICLLIFDEAGFFLSRHKAKQVSVSNYSTFKVLLPLSTGKKRIIHFVCNYNWSLFSDIASINKSENEIIPALSVGGGKIAYWQRLELANGISASALSQKINLLRNVLKVSVVNSTTTGTKRLNNLSFAMGDAYSMGTVSPFNTNLPQPFVEGADAITESPLGTLQSITEDSFILCGTSGSNTGVPFITYERKNSKSDKPSYIIIKGYYQNGGIINPNPSYYKVDIVEATDSKLYDLERNYHYLLKINTVNNSGHTSLAEAIHAPASNNLNSSVLMQEFTSISDGIGQLDVETTSRLFVNSDESFSIKYSYIPNSNNGVINNSGVQITLSQNSSKPVIKGGVINNDISAGVISGITANLPSITDIYTATITITAGNLQRKINLRLRQPYVFSNIYTNPANVANSTDQPVNLHFTIPNTVSASDFPIPVYITTQKLSPNIQPAANSHLSLDFLSGKYRYVYLAKQPGDHTVYFITNSNNSNELIKINSNLFNEVSYMLNTTNLSSLTNLSFSPNGSALLAQKGQSVTMTFTVPIISGVNPPYKIVIQSANLDFQSSTTGTVLATNYGYLYTTSKTGTQTLVFKTKVAESSEYVRIDGDRFASVGFQRLCNKLDFVNPRFSAMPSNAGQAISLWLGIPSTYNFANNDGKCDIYIYSTQLEPANGNPNNLQMIIDPQLGIGYKYIATKSIDQEIKFKSLNNYSPETVKMISDGFNETSIIRNFAFISPSITAKPINTGGVNTTMTMTFGIPNGSIPPSGSLVIRINTQDVLVAYPKTQIGLTRIGVDGDASSYYEYTVNKSGTYNITFRNQVKTSSTRQKEIVISATNFITSNNLN